MLPPYFPFLSLSPSYLSVFCSLVRQSVATWLWRDRRNWVTSLSRLVLGAKQPVSSHISSQPRSSLILETRQRRWSQLDRLWTKPAQSNNNIGIYLWENFLGKHGVCLTDCSKVTSAPICSLMLPSVEKAQNWWKSLGKATYPTSAVLRINDLYWYLFSS